MELIISIAIKKFKVASPDEIIYLFQIANHLDRAVASLGRKPLKVLVQVNTSGEECMFHKPLVVPDFWLLFLVSFALYIPSPSFWPFMLLHAVAAAILPISDLII